VVAARGGEHQLGLPVDGPLQGVVGGGVAGVQGEHHVGMGVELDLADPADDEAHLAGEAELVGERGVVREGLWFDVHPGQVRRETADPGEPGLGGEGEVGVAAAEVDDPPRLLGCGGAESAGSQRVVEGRGERPQELLHLAVLRLPARLDPALGVGDAQGPQHRVVLGQQPVLAAVVAPVGCCPGGRPGVHQRLLLLGHAELHGLGDGRGGWTCAPGCRRTPSAAGADRP
jgi:hypothetical protein